MSVERGSEAGITGSEGAGRSSKPHHGELELALRERVKELTALHGAARLLHHNSLPLEEILARFAALLPPAWQYPERATARVAYAGTQCATPGHASSPRMLRREFATGRGCIEIAYPQPPPDAGDPFLAEERALLDSLAEMLEVYIQRKETESELRRKAREFEAVAQAVEQAAESIVITDREGRILYVNPAFERASGYTRGEVLGQNPSLLRSGEQPPEYYAEMWRTILDGKVWTGTFTNRRKDGSLFQEEAAISPVRDASGAITNFVAVKRDVTRERELEQQVRQAQKMEAIGRLAGGVAHDFNNLLAVILGYTELALEQLPSQSTLRHSLEEISSAGERAASLTRQLLAFSRQQMLEPRVLDLNAVVRGVEKMLRRMIGEDIEMVTRLDPALGRVKADPSQIEQVLMNLAVNARDAMPGGGRLVIETANVHLDESYDLAHPQVPVPCGPYVRLTVSDSGTGMDTETQRHIFEPFFTTKEKGKGTGLGLATVYGIVKQSGGFIWVYSEPGHGSAFKIYLPGVDQPPAPAQGPRLSASVPRGTETILLAEDSDGLRELNRTCLTALGYTVLEAADGRAALRVAEQHPGPIHLLVTDVIMPRMGGRELAARLGELRPRAPILFISGYADEAPPDLAGRGAAFLQKPFRPVELARRVRELLDQSGGAAR